MVTSDAGLLLRCELDERLGLDALIEWHLTDPRTGHNRQFPVPDLFRQSIYSRLAGYEDTNDAERLAEDPRFGCWPRASGGGRAWRSQSASFGGVPPTPLQGPAQPSFKFNSSDFWAQGINAGLTFRF
jgi:hypothetical protein